VLEQATQFVRSPDGPTICFADFGPGDGYPVLFLHQSPGCRLSMRRPDRVAALGGRLISYDRPGCGQSARMRGRSVIDCVPDFEAVVDALGLAEFAVVGYSGGAPHALAVAARLAGRVSRVACYGAIAPLDQLGLAEWSKDQGPDMGDFVAALLAGEEALTPMLAQEDAEMRAAASPDDPVGAIILESTRTGVGGWVDDELAHARPWGFDVRDVVAPTWIWSNPNDTVTPPNHAAWLASRIPNAFVVTSPNALSHAAVDDPEAARTELYSWLIGSAARR
jgi:pimeloyl-ACP methyl ester carboxylesterase